MRRISNQRLECGYTEARPFRTINRAVIEAGIITSRDYLNLGNICGDLVTIVVMSGMHGALNGPWQQRQSPGAMVTSLQNLTSKLLTQTTVALCCLVVAAWSALTCVKPTSTQLTSQDFGEEGADYGNRSAIFRVTGTGYYYGFTFLDKIQR